MEHLLIERAQEACKKAYAPYSHYCVGAAILTHTGQIYTGCNVENVSYGLSICGERNAVFQAVSSEGPSMRLKAVAVVNGSEDDCAPCGACRQVLMEFEQDTLVFYRLKGEWKKVPLVDLLPGAFSFEPSLQLIHS